MVALPANEGYLVQSEQHQLQSQGHRESSRSTWSRDFVSSFKNFNSTLDFLNIQHTNVESSKTSTTTLDF